MTHWIVRDINISKVLNRPMHTDSQFVYDLFVNVLDGIEEIPIDIGVKWVKNGVTYFRQNNKNGYFWVSHKYICSKIESELGYKFNEIKALTTAILGHILKREVFPTGIIENRRNNK